MRMIVALSVVLSALLPAQPPALPSPSPTTNPGTRKARPDLFESGVAAMVNRGVITVADVREEIRVRIVGLPPAEREREYEGTLLRMILEKVMDQGTQRLQLILNDQQVTSHIENLKVLHGGEEGFREHLSRIGRTYEEFTAELKQEWARDLLVSAYAGERRIGDRLRPEHSIKPTAREIREYYERHMEDEFSNVAAAEIWAMTISLASVKPRTGRGTMEMALAKAKLIVEDLRTGADFAILAKRYDRISDEKKGYEGWREEDAPMNPKILMYAFSDVEIGEVSDPIPFGRGYFIVKVTGRKTARTTPFSEAQSDIRNKLRRSRLVRTTAQVRERLVRNAYIWPAVYKARLIGGLRADQRAP